jgi:hypothetical protein
MKFSEGISIVQALFGAILTCLAVYTFLNIENYSTFPITTQLYLIWTLVALALLIYGVLQFAQGMVATFGEK